MALTEDEKIAGRVFRETAQEELTASFKTDPPDYKAPNFLSHWRHECPGRNDISTAIELKEVYVRSPEYLVYTDQSGRRLAVTPDTSILGVYGPDPYIVPEGRFAFIYKQGKCKSRGCGRTARSPAGRVVDAWERPPIEGRVARSTSA